MGRQRAHDRRALFQAVQGREISAGPPRARIEHGAIVGMNHISDRPAFLPLTLEKHFHAAREYGGFTAACHTNDF